MDDSGSQAVDAAAEFVIHRVLVKSLFARAGL
jgi:hypothetical protein